MDESTRTALTDPRSKYTPDEKVLAALVWLTHNGTYEETSRVLEREHSLVIPSHTIRKWKQRDTWWLNAVREARALLDCALSDQWVYMQQEAAKQLIAILEDGEEHVTKDGDVIHKKLSAKDLIAVGQEATRGRSLATGEGSGEGSAIENALNRIADKLREVAQASKPAQTYEGEIVNGEFTEEKQVLTLPRPGPPETV